METNMNTKERVRHYVVVHEQSKRIVATVAGTHRLLERYCERLDRIEPGSYIYDDASEAGEYLPQFGENLR